MALSQDTEFGKTIPGIDSGTYDYVRAFAATRSKDPVVIDEAVQAYIEIAKLLEITPIEFIHQIRSYGTKLEQDVFLAGYLNQVRYKNALIGVTIGYRAPDHVARELRA